MKKEKKYYGYDRPNKVISAIIYVFCGIVAISCLLPILNVLAISFSSKEAANANIVRFLPVDFTLVSYKMIFARKTIRTAFWVSVKRTFLAVVISNILTLLMAYPLSKENRDFKGRNVYSFFIIFAMLFNGGLVPMYILIKNLHLIDSIWALVLPGAVPIFNVILMMNFMRQLPKEIEEAAFVDGADYFQSLIHIIIPLSMPVIATVTLFQFVANWNEWFGGLIYMRDTANYPLQTLLQTTIKATDITNLEQMKIAKDVNDRTLKAAQIFVTTLPILVLYPFLQKYFVKGIVLGSVKG